MKDVLLLCMPFYELHRPSLALGTLKAVLLEHGIGCDVLYPNFDFADICGFDVYDSITRSLPYEYMLGEWVFKSALYGQSEANAYPFAEITGIDEAELLRLQKAAEQWLDLLPHHLPLENYRVIGFTSSFHQNMASLALAKKIKERSPDKVILFGGANCEGVMGFTLHQQYPFIDYVFTGESEIAMPALVKCILQESKPADFYKIPGVVYRDAAQSVVLGETEKIENLDSIPIPDHKDFFLQVEKYRFEGLNPLMLFETSRGCWWGSKSQCLFCGLNGESLKYRSKTPPRVLDEIRTLSRNYPARVFHAGDNVLNKSFYHTLLPELAAYEPETQYFFEIRSNIKRWEAEQLSNAGVIYVQPGIESLSDNLLRLMRKGVSAMTNIYCLKLLKEYGITPEWNIMIGFPGDSAEDYEEILKVIPYILHLHPPASVGRMRLDRFSPYFNHPGEYGITGIEPNKYLRNIYPFNDEVLKNLAYSFNFHMGSKDYTPVIERLLKETEKWNDNKDTAKLEYTLLPKGIRINDTRFHEASEYELSVLETVAYLYCDEPRTLKEITLHLSGKLKRPLESYVVEAFLNELAEAKLMIKNKEQYLSLAVRLNI